MKPLSRRHLSLDAFFALLAFICLYFVSNSHASVESDKRLNPTGSSGVTETPVIVTSTPTDSPLIETLRPEYYGLPEVIAGYRIMAVETAKNTGCMPDDRIRLVLQSSAPDIEAFLKVDPSGTVETELKKYDLHNKTIEFEYAGPGVTEQAVLESALALKPNDTTFCHLLGPIPEPTTTPA